MVRREGAPVATHASIREQGLEGDRWFQQRTIGDSIIRASYELPQSRYGVCSPEVRADCQLFAITAPGPREEDSSL